MGRTYDVIDDRLAAFIERQPVFFVATAPLSPDGLVNCSPKGNRGDFRVLDGHRVAYRDLTGSGVETIAHFRENGRIVLMWCSFDGPPRIVRLHGHGESVAAGHPDFDDLVGQFRPDPLTRAVIRMEVARVSDSCGYGVPLMTLRGHRENFDHWGRTKGEDGLATYRAEHNARSVDGMPALG